MLHQYFLIWYDSFWYLLPLILYEFLRYLISFKTLMPITRANARVQEWAAVTTSPKKTKITTSQSNCSNSMNEKECNEEKTPKTNTDDGKVVKNEDCTGIKNNYDEEIRMLRAELTELKELIQQSMVKKNVADEVTTDAPQEPSIGISLGSSFGSRQTLHLEDYSDIVSLSEEEAEVEIHDRIQKLRTQTEPQSAHPVLFNGRDHPLSNCYQHAWCSKECTIVFKKRSFKTAENAWAWLFLESHGLPEEAQSASEADPFAAKSMCKRVKANHKWLDNQIKLMAELIDAKFDSCDGFRTFLLESKEALVENTRDPFWGGIPSFNGINTMGHMLMKKRAKENRAASRTFVSNAKAAPKQQQQNPTTRFGQGCQKCGESNHSTNKCRHEFPLKCNICNGKGHKAKMCPNDQPNEQIRTTNTAKTNIGPPHRTGTVAKQSRVKHNDNNNTHGQIRHRNDDWQPHPWDTRIYQTPTSPGFYHRNNQRNEWHVTKKPETLHQTAEQYYPDNQMIARHGTIKEPTPYPPREYYNMYSVLQPVTEAKLANSCAYQRA